MQNDGHNKICLVVARYSISGVPLAQIRLARAFAERGYSVNLIIGYIPNEHSIPEIDGVRVVNFGRNRVLNLFQPMTRYLRREKPDIVFTAEDHMNAIVLLAAIFTRSKAKISGSSRVTPFDTYAGRKGKMLKFLMWAVTWRADALTCVSEDMVLQYRSIFKNTKHVCVYNIADISGSKDLMAERVECTWFHDDTIPVVVAAGQLGPWKGFTDLIRAVHIVSEHRPIRLVILGEGAQREELQTLINELGLDSFVSLPGNVSNTLKYFARADVFVLSSLLEGMPNVLIEAMMAGCTPVATDCPTGPREILESGRYGYLVKMKNPASLAAGIEQALTNPVPPELLSEAIRPFEVSKVLEKHFEVLGLCKK